jgi:hypothetical protein
VQTVKQYGNIKRGCKWQGIKRSRGLNGFKRKKGRKEAGTNTCCDKDETKMDMNR